MVVTKQQMNLPLGPAVPYLETPLLHTLVSDTSVSLQHQKFANNSGVHQEDCRNQQGATSHSVLEVV
jgi:hypothetical protein